MNRITSTAAGAAALMAAMGLANIFCAPSLPPSNESEAEDLHLGPLRTYKFDTVRVDARGVRSGVWEGGHPESRVLRGGSWYDSAKQCRSAYRLKFDADARLVGAGFRVAMAARN